MPPRRERQRLRSPQGLGLPTNTTQLKSYFMERSLDVTAPCTAAPGSVTTSTLATPMKRCWVVQSLGLWNLLLHPVGIELRENISGELILQRSHYRAPKVSESSVVCIYLLKRLLIDHHCVENVYLGFVYDTFHEKSKLQMGSLSKAGIQKITLGREPKSPLLRNMLFLRILQREPADLTLCLRDLDAEALSALVLTIKTSARLTDLTLYPRRLKDRDIVRLLGAIEASKSLKSLDIDNAMIGVPGARRLAEWLTTNKTLLRLRLTLTRIEDEGTVAIGEALAVNKTLESLMIVADAIGPTGAETIAASLRVNANLISLNLSYNRLETRGAISIAKALQANKTLRKLDISGNAIDQDGIAAVADSLANNRSLLELVVSGNYFEELGIAALARLVDSTQTLKRLGAVPISPVSSGPLAEALAHNRSLVSLQMHVSDSHVLTTLPQTLRCNETLRELCIYNVKANMSVLFAALVVNRSVLTFKFCGPLCLESVKAFANLLRTTTTIRFLSIEEYRYGWSTQEDLNRSLTQLVNGLAFNASIWSFHVLSSAVRGIDIWRIVARMFERNRTLQEMVFTVAFVDEEGLAVLAAGLSSNQFLQHLFIPFKASGAACFSVNECLRRNSVTFSHAVQFVLKQTMDKESAADFELYRRSEFFAHQLSKLPASASSAGSLIRQADNYIAQNYFVITGVVKRFLVCLKPRRRTVTTQLDTLNRDCLIKVASYLNVADVK